MKSGSVAVVRPNSVPLRPLLATRNPSWICLGQAEQALSFAISALRGKRKWSKAVYLEGGERSSGYFSRSVTIAPLSSTWRGSSLNVTKAWLSAFAS